MKQGFALLLCCEMFFAACAHCPEEHDSVRLACSPPLTMESATQEEWSRWKAVSERIIAPLESREGKAYGDGELEFIWRLPPQKGLPAGATVIDGSWTEITDNESMRRDLRVMLFRTGDGKEAVIVDENASRRLIEFADLSHEQRTYVLLSGTNWRGGSHFSLHEWDLSSGTLSKLWGVDGEEETADLVCQFSYGQKLHVILRGVRREKHAALLQAASKLRELGIDISLTKSSEAIEPPSSSPK